MCGEPHKRRKPRNLKFKIANPLVSKQTDCSIMSLEEIKAVNISQSSIIPSKSQSFKPILPIFFYINQTTNTSIQRRTFQLMCDIKHLQFI